MSVYTDADSKVHAAHANIRAAAESLSAPIEGLQEIVFRRCWGSTDYNAAYAERVQKTYERPGSPSRSASPSAASCVARRRRSLMPAVTSSLATCWLTTTASSRGIGPQVASPEESDEPLSPPEELL